MILIKSSCTTVKNSDTNDINSNSLSLKPSENLSLLFNQFKKFSPEQKNQLENVGNSKYYDIDQFENLKFSDEKVTILISYKIPKQSFWY